MQALPLLTVGLSLFSAFQKPKYPTIPSLIAPPTTPPVLDPNKAAAENKAVDLAGDNARRQNLLRTSKTTRITTDTSSQDLSTKVKNLLGE